MSRFVTVAVAVILFASMLLLGACGGDDAPSEAELEVARTEAAAEARKNERIRDLQEKLEEKNDPQTQSGGAPISDPSPAATSSPSAPSSSSIPSSARDCGEVFADGSASCPFAQNVQSDYYSSGGSSLIRSYSPVTGITYDVTCNGSAPTVCTGGNNAVIYIP